MKFLIKGVPVDLESGLTKASLTTLYELKRDQGISIKTLAECAVKMGALTDPLVLLDDLEMFQMFRVLIWLARLHRGDMTVPFDGKPARAMTLEEANDDFGIGDLTVEQEDGDVVPDPKAQALAAFDPDEEFPPTAAE